MPKKINGDEQDTVFDQFVICGFDELNGELETDCENGSNFDDSIVDVNAHIDKSPLSRRYKADVLRIFPKVASTTWPHLNKSGLCQQTIPSGLTFRVCERGQTMDFNENCPPLLNESAAHSFVLVKDDGSKLYGTSIVFFERVDSEKVREAMYALQNIWKTESENAQFFDNNPQVMRGGGSLPIDDVSEWEILDRMVTDVRRLSNCDRARINNHPGSASRFDSLHRSDTVGRKSKKKRSLSNCSTDRNFEKPLMSTSMNREYWNSSSTGFDNGHFRFVSNGDTRVVSSNVFKTCGSSWKDRCEMLFDMSKHDLYVSKSISLLSKLPLREVSISILEAMLQYFQNKIRINFDDINRISSNQTAKFLKRKKRYLHVKVLEGFLKTLLFDIPVPEAGFAVRFWCLSSKKAMTISCPASPRELPSSGICDIGQFLRCSTLGGHHLDWILDLLTCVLLEYQILAVSQSTSQLVNFCETLTTLIYPMVWCHVYITTLPIQLKSFIDAPVPYIIAIHVVKSSDLENLMSSCHNCVICDLDTPHIELPDEMPSFPNKNDVIFQLSSVLNKDYDVEELYSQSNGSSRNSKISSRKNSLSQDCRLQNTKDSKYPPRDIPIPRSTCTTSSLASEEENEMSSSSLLIEGDDPLRNLSLIISKFENATRNETSKDVANNDKGEHRLSNEVTKCLYPNKVSQSDRRRNPMLVELENAAVREIFVQNFVQILNRVDEFISLSDDFRSPPHFDSISFLSDQNSQELIKFLSPFVESQMFANFLDTWSKLSDTIDSNNLFLKPFKRRVDAFRHADNGSRFDENTTLRNFETSLLNTEIESVHECLLYRISNVKYTVTPRKIDRITKTSDEHLFNDNYESFPLFDENMFDVDSRVAEGVSGAAIPSSHILTTTSWSSNRAIVLNNRANSIFFQSSFNAKSSSSPDHRDTKDSSTEHCSLIKDLLLSELKSKVEKLIANRSPNSGNDSSDRPKVACNAFRNGLPKENGLQNGLLRENVANRGFQNGLQGIGDPGNVGLNRHSEQTVEVANSNSQTNDEINQSGNSCGAFRENAPSQIYEGRRILSWKCRYPEDEEDDKISSSNSNIHKYSQIDAYESTLLTSICDILERIWSHGFNHLAPLQSSSKSPNNNNKTKAKMSAIWQNLLFYLGQNLSDKDMQKIFSSDTSMAYVDSSESNVSKFGMQKSNLINIANLSSQIDSAMKIELLASIVNILSMKNCIKTEMGLGRAWIRLAFEKRCLHKFLSQLLSHGQKFISESYKSVSILKRISESIDSKWSSDDLLSLIKELDVDCHSFTKFTLFENCYPSVLVLYKIQVIVKLGDNKNLSKPKSSTFILPLLIQITGTERESPVCLIHCKDEKTVNFISCKSLGILTSLRCRIASQDSNHGTTLSKEGLKPAKSYSWNKSSMTDDVISISAMVITNEFTGYKYIFTCNNNSPFFSTTTISDKSYELYLVCSIPKLENPFSFQLPLSNNSFTSLDSEDVEDQIVYLQTMLGNGINSLLRDHCSTGKSYSIVTSYAELMSSSCKNNNNHHLSFISSLQAILQFGLKSQSSSALLFNLCNHIRVNSVWDVLLRIAKDFSSSSAAATTKSINRSEDEQNSLSLKSENVMNTSLECLLSNVMWFGGDNTPDNSMKKSKQKIYSSSTLRTNQRSSCRESRQSFHRSNSLVNAKDALRTFSTCSKEEKSDGLIFAPCGTLRSRSKRRNSESLHSSRNDLAAFKTFEFRRMYTNLILEVENRCSHLHNDNKFHLFVCLSVHDRLLRRIVIDLTLASIIQQVYDPNAFLVRSDLTAFMSSILSPLDSISIHVDPALKNCFERHNSFKLEK